jgi:LytS/YehU family sensor histidine kinase
MALGIGTSITAVQKSQKDTLLRQEEALLRKSLEQQKTDSELSFLKAQINPHFFFNTLNNIYALTMINVESSRQVLLKLSRMMRYVLYETQKDGVLLSQEIAFVQDYIELMQLRLTDKVEVIFKRPTPLKEVTIAPMLRLPFVEKPPSTG